jgi:hypothetical protein
MEKRAEAEMLADEIPCHIIEGTEGRGFSPAVGNGRDSGGFSP